MTLLDDLKEKPVPKLDNHVLERIYEETNITLLNKNNINDLLVNTEIQKEIGYSKLKDGSYLIAMNNNASNITKDMLEWWFWWIGKNNEGYKVWYPKAHINLLNKTKIETFNGFQPARYKITNDFGKGPVEFTLKLRKKEYFGFNTSQALKNNITTIISGNIGNLHGYYGHSTICHLLKETRTDDNELITRIRIGKHIPNIIKRQILTEDNLYILSKYIYISYTRLNEILPIIYENYREEFYKVEIEEI